MLGADDKEELVFLGRTDDAITKPQQLIPCRRDGQSGFLDEVGQGKCNATHSQSCIDEPGRSPREAGCSGFLFHNSVCAM